MDRSDEQTSLFHHFSMILPSVWEVVVMFGVWSKSRLSQPPCSIKQSTLLWFDISSKQSPFTCNQSIKSNRFLIPISCDLVWFSLLQQFRPCIKLSIYDPIFNQSGHYSVMRVPDWNPRVGIPKSHHCPTTSISIMLLGLVLTSWFVMSESSTRSRLLMLWVSWTNLRVKATNDAKWRMMICQLLNPKSTMSLVRHGHYAGLLTHRLITLHFAKPLTFYVTILACYCQIALKLSNPRSLLLLLWAIR